MKNLRREYRPVGSWCLGVACSEMDRIVLAMVKEPVGSVASGPIVAGFERFQGSLCC